jgi:DNA recombination protein RmuC
VEFVVALLGVVVVGLLVVLVLVARAARTSRQPQAPHTTSSELPVDQLLRMQHEMLAAERRRGTEELRGTQTAIDHQVQAMRAELARLNRLVEETERDRREHVGELTSQLQAAGRQTQVLAETTQSLREALSSTTARGQWGERMAEDVLRLAGFVDGVNYRRHQPLPGSGGIPDYTFLLPQGLTLHMDVKFPLNNYLRVVDATSDVEREHSRKEFLKDVRQRLREVTRREYVDPAGGTVDCVLLFIPNEQVYAFIQEQDRSILDDALRAKVVFCSPLTLFAVLAVIRQAVDNFQLSRTSQVILERLQGFEKQWDRFVEQMDKVGRNLKTASNAFEELEGTRRRGVERELERIDALRRDQDAAPRADEPPQPGVLPLAVEA